MKDDAVRVMPWPLPRADEIEPAPPSIEVAGNVVPLGARA